MVTVMLDRVGRRAAAVQPGRAVRAVLLAPLWLAGAAIGAAATLLWAAGRWAAAAVTTGFRDAAPDIPAIPALWVGRLALAAAVIGVVIWMAV